MVKSLRSGSKKTGVKKSSTKASSKLSQRDKMEIASAMTKGSRRSISSNSPIGIHAFGILGGVEVHDIKYDINDTIEYKFVNPAGESGEMKKAIIHSDSKGQYFMAEKVKIYFNEIEWR